MKGLSTLVGIAIVGFLFFAWYGQQRGGKSLDDRLMGQNDIAEARMDAGATDTRDLNAPDEVSGRRSSRKAPEQSSDSELLAVAGEPTTSKLSVSKIRREIDKLADIAIAGAIDTRKHVPAGTSLSLLIYQAERGKQFTSSNLRTVMDYLLSIKENADESDARKYFKYSSNSEKWFAGLQLDRNGGHPVEDLTRIYRQYNLKQFDKNAYAAITGKTSTMQFEERVEPQEEVPAMDGDPAMSEVRSNHANAMNRWADKESKGTKAETRFLPARELDNNSVSAARQSVEDLRVGQSITFDNPDKYHAAVKEMIALENDYNTWKAYEQEMGKDKAKRAFRKRAEKGGVMATGTLKVTRER